MRFQTEGAGTTHWFAPNADATNITGFTAVAGGYGEINSFYDSILFDAKGYMGIWWSPSESDGVPGFMNACGMLCFYKGVWIYSTLVSDYKGYSVRCVKD